MESNFYPLLFIVAIISIIVVVFITRWLFRIDTIVNYHKAQTALLMKIALKQGVSAEELEELKNIVRKD